jgi:hypothetical protein
MVKEQTHNPSRRCSNEDSFQDLINCRFDFCQCFRNHCCYSRFYSEFYCSRFVPIIRSRFTPRLVKVVS